MILGFEHSVQLSVLLKAIGAGYALGLLYCVFMFFNSLWNKHTIAVFFRDVLFFTIAAVMSFLFALKYNAGIIRFYILAGELMGFCIFYIFPGVYVGSFLRGIGKKIITLWEKIKKRICGVVYRSNERIKNVILKMNLHRKNKRNEKDKKQSESNKKEKTHVAGKEARRKKLCFKQKNAKKFVKTLDIKK